MGSNVHAEGADGHTPLHDAAIFWHEETIRVLVEMEGDVHAQGADGYTQLHVAASKGHAESVKVLVKMGSDVHARDADGVTPLLYTAIGGHLDPSLQHAETGGYEAVVSFLRKNSKNYRRSKSTTVPVVDPAAQAVAEVAAAAMATLLIAEEEDQKQAPPSKQGSSKKARKHRNRRKANPDELDTGSKGPDEATGGSLASSRGRDNAGERDDMGRDVPCHNKPDGEVDAHDGEESAGLLFNNAGRSHNEPEMSIGRDVQRVEDSSVACEAGTCPHSGVQQPTATQAEKHRQPKQRERQRQRKRATT
jgi:hypothetical protein